MRSQRWGGILHLVLGKCRLQCQAYAGMAWTIFLLVCCRPWGSPEPRIDRFFHLFPSSASTSCLSRTLFATLPHHLSTPTPLTMGTKTQVRVLCSQTKLNGYFLLCSALMWDCLWFCFCNVCVFVCVILCPMWLAVGGCLVCCGATVFLNHRCKGVPLVIAYLAKSGISEHALHQP
jgi:hypothetical protein